MDNASLSNSSTQSDDSLAIRRRNWATVGILLLVNLLNYMDRFTIVGVMPQLQEYFQMDNKQMGLLQTIFITFYMLFAPLCGYLGDRYNRKAIMVAGVTVWIVAVIASTFVRAGWYKTFLFLRGVVGVGEASYSTIAPTILADIFTGTQRSRVLMIFYFAIPVGSGMGFIAGSNISLVAGTWQWGVRFTPVLGFFCLLMIIFVLREPTRGAAEHAHLNRGSTIKEDLQYLAHVRTFHLITIGQTAVIFAVGAISWWAPIFMGDAYSLSYGYAPPAVKARNELIFGVITCVAGISGLILGSATAQRWRLGLPPFVHPSHEADALVCGFASLASIPFFYAALIFSASSINFTWFILFIAITLMCMNWAVNMDILMYVIVANRRATAAAFQVMICHMFGDATSPYIVGAISDAIRGDDKSAIGEYYSLRTAMFVPTFTLVLSAAAYLSSSFTLDKDRKKALDEMGVEDDWRSDIVFEDDVETLIPNMQRDDSYADAFVEEQAEVQRVREDNR